jgi:hypothetical protein
MAAIAAVASKRSYPSTRVMDVLERTGMSSRGS